MGFDGGDPLPRAPDPSRRQRGLERGPACRPGHARRDDRHRTAEKSAGDRRGDGPQDMGGLHGVGRVEPESDEPPFHADWERRAMALTLAMAVPGGWNLDMSRSARES